MRLSQVSAVRLPSRPLACSPSTSPPWRPPAWRTLCGLLYPATRAAAPAPSRATPRLSLVYSRIQPFSTTSAMSALASAGQAPHPTLLIPGPIEIDDVVAGSMAHYAESHVGLPFCVTFGETLSMLRK